MKTGIRAAASVALTLMFLSGCEQAGSTPAPVEPQAGTQVHDHSGWWCNEHGVPEEVCALCSSRIAAEFQKQGDWCAEHDRPDSQCFICHPEHRASFAAQYRAEYGEDPPATEDES